jgi:cytochrome o ubiquinol oxidase subunit 2
MSKKYILLTIFLSTIALVITGLLFQNSDSIAMLNPKGMIALKERDLMIIATILMLIVVIPVFILTAAIAWEYRATNKESKYTPEWDYNLTAESVWWGFPCIIIAILSFVSWQSTHELDPYKPLQSPVKPLTIQVVALQWKWLFIYPEQNIATINYLQIPVQTPINFQITADAPMNSFWIPELGGQIYAMPGMKTKLHLIADDIGLFRGCSANISGEGYSGMYFDVKATHANDFEDWVKSVKKSLPLDVKEYKTLAEPSSYVPVALFTLGKADLFDWIAMIPMRAPEERVIQINSDMKGIQEAGKLNRYKSSGE